MCPLPFAHPDPPNGSGPRSLLTLSCWDIHPGMPAEAGLMSLLATLLPLFSWHKVAGDSYSPSPAPSTGLVYGHQEGDKCPLPISQKGLKEGCHCPGSRYRVLGGPQASLMLAAQCERFPQPQPQEACNTSACVTVIIVTTAADCYWEGPGYAPWILPPALGWAQQMFFAASPFKKVENYILSSAFSTWQLKLLF